MKYIFFLFSCVTLLSSQSYNEIILKEIQNINPTNQKFSFLHLKTAILSL
ncbi:hypothetical protein [Sulfurimonas autotrophica]|uniref:Uncharacterized protein n=1 Tax=Sulfurimonas autotrophica (strain ATCC BAA-671 / DSM 16294 / JCM 11897 / OK10) TaxID=563040 RepID=E0UPJ8_SULAO|nr:hypothetical protein [Sulfurimonas autotrophica]ADN09728.1 hypothetical protein Saut_1684 [Sulfurimonas autotrophica DSM 16294]